MEEQTREALDQGDPWEEGEVVVNICLLEEGLKSIKAAL